jgi:hypothetical protein
MAGALFAGAKHPGRDDVALTSTLECLTQCLMPQLPREPTNQTQICAVSRRCATPVVRGLPRGHLCARTRQVGDARQPQPHPPRAAQGADPPQGVCGRDERASVRHGPALHGRGPLSKPRFPLPREVGELLCHASACCMHARPCATSRTRHEPGPPRPFTLLCCCE